MELHTFTDASESPIGAIVYIRLINKNGLVQISFVISSSKLVPRACISMPRNIACRPHTPEALAKSVWFRGPDFLWDVEGHELPLCPTHSEELPETIEEKVVLKTDKQCEHPLEVVSYNVSSLEKAIGAVVVVLRFRDNLLHSTKKIVPPEKLDDRENAKEEAMRLLVLAAQQKSFVDLLKVLKRGQAPVAPGLNKLAPYDPFVDNMGVIRVGGRLRDSFLTYAVKHPMLLSKDHPLSTLVVRFYHEKTQHQGRHLTIGAIRMAGYFVQQGSRLVRRVIENCVKCKKLRAQPAEQMMAPLPSSRVEDIAPFHHTGIDVFGPFIITDGKSTRQTKGTKKIWGLILTCMASRAIHIEALQGLDTSSLTNALRRFIAIRGACQHVYSDRGTNFIGINNQSESTSMLDDVKSALDVKGVKWHFNPPHASHFGGAWERKIGALKRVFEGSILHMKNRVLNRDEFTTLLFEAMAIVNNTPMYEVSSDPRDPTPISPAMLLSLKDTPNPSTFDTYSAEDCASYGAKRWRRVQFLAGVFWQKWRTYYLSGLQERSKWIRKNRNITVGDVILLVNKGEKRNCWPLAIVKKVKTSADGFVRSVSIETSSGGESKRLLDRPISEVILLVPSERCEH